MRIKEINVFFLAFATVFGIIMGTGFLFLGYTQNQFHYLIYGYTMIFLGIICAVLLKED